MDTAPERSIDPSALRDGEVVRATRGVHSLVEGVWSGADHFLAWVIESEDGVHLATGADPGWTITAIVCPLLVTGDHVHWREATRGRLLAGVYAGPADSTAADGFSLVIDDDRNRVVVATELLTRTPASPTPDGARSASITVGDWWTFKDSEPQVVITTHGTVWTRSWRNADAYDTHQDAAAFTQTWTRLDGPPEPPVGSEYVIDRLAWQHRAEGHIPAMHVGGDVVLAQARTWERVCAVYTKATLATLEIVEPLSDSVRAAGRAHAEAHTTERQR